MSKELENALLEAIYLALSTCNPPPQKIWVAYSGGLDSTVLLTLAAQVAKQLSCAVAAVHVHHGVAAQADAWVVHCQRICHSLNIPLCVHYRTQSETPVIKDTAVSESELRSFRYQAFAQTVASNEPLLLAHHQQDQAETLLLRLCRGTGVYGLQGIWPRRQQQDLYLIRPWLNFSRAQLRMVAEHLALSWIEDPSNQSCIWRRNFIRQQVLPLLQQQWPHVDQQLANLADQVQQHQYAQDWLLAPYIEQVRITRTVLSVSKLQELPVSVQKLVLASWLRELMGELVSDTWIETLLRNGQVQYQQICIEHFQNCWWFIKNAAPELIDNNLPDIEVRYRQGGEKILRAHNRPHHTLKQLFQDQQVPPWLRPRWPLLYFHHQLVAIPLLWVHPDYQHHPVAQVTWQPQAVQEWMEWRAVIKHF